MLGDQLLMRAAVEADEADEEEFASLSQDMNWKNYHVSSTQWDWKKTCIYSLLFLLLLFPYITIPILFGMVESANKNCSSNDNLNLELSFSDASPGSNSASMSSGATVSRLGENAATIQAQVGAGTSLYIETTSINANCPIYMDMNPIYENMYLVGYSNKVSETSEMQIISVTDADQASVVHSQNAPYYFYDIVTLSQETGLFVGIAQDTSNTTNTSYLVAGMVDATTYEITFGEAFLYSIEEFSVNPLITSLSTSSFAISFFVDNSTMLTTRYGFVDASTLALTVSADFDYCSNAHTSIQPAIVGVNEKQYLLMYYNSSVNKEDDINSGYGPLNVITATIQDNLQLSLSPVSTLSTSTISFYFKATPLLDNTVVVTYADPSINYGIRCQVIKVVNGNDGTNPSVVFGSNWIANSGQALEELHPYLFMDIDIVTISDNNRFMILYSDVSNEGKMTATVGELTASQEIIRSSPDFVISAKNSEKLYPWGALAAGITKTGATRTGILTSFAGQDCSLIAYTNFSLMESKSSTLGIIANVNGDSASVTVSGVVQNDEWSFKTGAQCYTNSMGNIFVSDGVDGNCIVDTNKEFYYVYDSERNALVTTDSLVGISTSPSSLLILAK